MNEAVSIPTKRRYRRTHTPASASSRAHRSDPVGISPTHDQLERLARIIRRNDHPVAIDLFSGAGGLSLGLKDAGFKVVVAADHDRVALETHRNNLGGVTYAGDLSKTSSFLSFLDDLGVGRVSLVAGGPPCQPFSRAGLPKIRSLVRNGDREARDGRVDLWRSFTDVVDVLEPQAVLFENVPDLTRWNDGEVLVGIMTALRERGFTPHARVLVGSEYGVPQHRARLFIVGLRTNEFRWPNRVPAVTLGDAVSDLPPIPAGERRECLPYAGPRTPFQRRARRGVHTDEDRTIYDHVARGVRPDDAEAFELLRPGQTYRDLPDRLQRYRNDIFVDKYKRLDASDVCRTITAHIARDGYWYIHPSQVRTLSIREAARVQTFPDSFRFSGGLMAQYRQIGNAVPPALACAVARRVMAALEHGSTPTRVTCGSFSTDLMRWWKGHRRSFPWRNTRDPWLVLLAEVCLRRTWAAQVAERFGRIAEVAPDARVAVRRKVSLRRALAGLGLEKRARGLLDLARVIVAEHDGHVPDNEEALRALPGVGHYIAGAVRCFAFGRAAVLLDANTSRIAARVAGQRAMSPREARLEILRLSGAEGPTPRFNYALLDLGGLICHPGTPDCGVCPMSAHCATGKRRVS